jgi:flagellar biosynthetic protein FlhB
MADKDAKTQEPTDKKLADAREKGDTPTAPEMRHAVMLVAMIVVAGSMGASALARLAPLFVRLWGSAGDYPLTADGAHDFATAILLRVAVALAPLFALLTAFALLTLFGAGLPTLSWSRVGIKWSKLSPVAGLGRMFGMRALVEFAKTLAKLIAVITIALVVVWPKAIGLEQLIGADPGTVGTAAAAIIVAMIKAVALLVGALAAFDLVYQRRAFTARMRMSLQEVKDEHRQSEGDPKIKAKIRAIGMQRARRRMMAAVPTASVVITNPTHYAVALKYDHGGMAAPVVVAKGADDVALKIREVAKAAGVPIVESPPLARAIFASVDIDRPIPIEHYAAVAEIIGHIMRLAQRRR